MNNVLLYIFYSILYTLDYLILIYNIIYYINSYVFVHKVL